MFLSHTSRPKLIRNNTIGTFPTELD
jgi:hypothetical protein